MGLPCTRDRCRGSSLTPVATFLAVQGYAHDSDMQIDTSAERAFPRSALRVAHALAGSAHSASASNLVV